MRLLNVQSFELQTFNGDEIPPYAILSHTWLPDEQEATYCSLLTQNLQWHNIPGATKIKFLCQQADKDGLLWAWIDTCCIDKTNSVELSEAINSMFRWYQNANVCYAYLVDVNEDIGMGFEQSRWWSRAWTLQELVASSTVHFYDSKWRFLGTKANMSDAISSRSGIDCDTLRNATTIHIKSVACRLSWAANREATRIEDVAYSLLGIFGVSMNMQYGETQTAFKRLQKQILDTTNDQSLFAWGSVPQTLQEVVGEHEPGTHEHDSSDSEDELRRNCRGIRPACLLTVRHDLPTVATLFSITTTLLLLMSRK